MLGTEPAEPGPMTRPPRPRSEHLLHGMVGKRIALAFGPLESLAAMASFLFASAMSTIPTALARPAVRS